MRKKIIKLQTLAYIILTMNLSAQYSGTINVPNATFGNLSVLVDSLNAYGLNGALTVNVTAAQTAPTNGYVLGNTGSALLTTLSTTNTLTINGGGNTIDAFVGTRLGSSSSGINDAIFSLVGVDYVTIKRFVFNELSTNTTVTTAMECAIALYNVGTTAGSANGCQFVTLDSNVINLGNVNSVAGAFTIMPYTMNGTTAASWTGGTADVHRSITISNNTLNDGFNGVVYRGSTTAQSRALVVRNNTFNNLGASASTASMYGCWFFYLDSAIIHNNTFNFDPAHGSGTSYGIFWSTNCGGVAEAVGNNINLRHNGNSQTIGISAGSLLGSAFTLRKNYISFGNMPTLTTGALMGVQHTYGGGNIYTITIDSNIIEGTSPQATSGQLTGFSIGGNSTLASATITNNIVRRINRTGLGATSLLNSGIYVTTMLNLTASNNIVDSIMYTNTSGTTAAVVNGIYGITVTNININNNRISNLFVRGATTATSSAVRGIYTSASASTVQNISNNNIFNLGIDRSVTTGGGLVNGIHLLPGTSTPLNIELNRIYNLSNNGATGTVNGMLFSQGAMNVSNNFISNLTSPNSTLSNGLVGFNATAGGPVLFDYNTINIGATAPITSSSSSFGASGIFIGSVATALTARNNIVNIKGVSSSAASNIAALRRVSGTAGTKPSNFTLSNNIWNVNKTSGTENYIYAEGTATTFTNAYHIGGGSSGTNDATTFNSACGAYKSWMGDVAAFTEDSLVAGGVAGTWVPNSASLAQNSAVTLAGITIDNSGATRNATTPDRGALEFAGTAGQDLVPPSISYTNVPNLNCSNAPTISATITDATGVNTTTFKPRLYYKFSGNVNDSVTNTSAGNGWKWIETSSTSNPYTFTFDFSKLNVAVAVDSVIQYFIVAQDVASVPNVANNIVSFNTGFCPSSVVLRQAGFPVSGVKSFKILSPPTVFMTAKPNPVCYLNNDTLNIAIGSYTDVTIGNGSGSLVSTFGNPYRTGAGTTTHRLQYLVAKSELDAAGILAGNINSLSMTTSSTMTGSITNYEIKLAHTAATNMTTTFLTPTFTTQFTAATLTVVAPGVNLHSFSSPFTWNGNDNIVIEICYSTVTGTTATTVANPTSPHITTPTIHATGGGCTAATGSTSVLRPQFIFNALSGSPMSSITWRDTSNNVLSTSNPYIAQPSFSGNTSNTQKFRVTAIDPSGCSFNDSIIVNKNTTLPSISAKSLSNTFPCFGDSITVSSTVLNGCPPYTYNFTIATSLGGSKSPLLLSSTNKFFPTIDKGYVYLLITDNNNQKDSTLIDSFELPAAPIADHDTICGTGQATLNALGVTDALWYNKSNLEVPIQTTGTSFITPIISATDTFYVSNKISFTSAQGGRLTNPTGGSALGGVPRGVIFDLSQAMKMDSIGLLCGGNAGTATIQLYNSTGTAAISTPIVVNIAASGTSPNLQMFKVNWPSLAIGTYRIFVTGVTGTTPLWYEFTGVTGYPYAISGTSGSVGNITASATALTGAASTTTYYYFYKLVFGEKCESRKVPVYAVSGSAPALSMSGAGPLQICNTTTNTTSDTIKVLAGATSFNSYVWNPASVTGDSSKGWVFNTTRNGQDTFTLTALNTATNCQQVRNVLVNPVPYLSTINTTTNIDTHCISGASTISIIGSPTLGATYQWESSANGTSGWSPIGAATNASYTTPSINNTTFYRAIISCSGSPITGGGVSPTAVKQIVVNNPTLDSVKHDTICGIDSAQLRAFTAAPKVIQWYDKNGKYLDSGSLFHTPVLLGTDTFYAAAAVIGSSYNAVKNVATATPPGTGGNAALNNYGFNITITKPIILNSIDVFSGTGTSMTVTLYNADGSTILNTTTATTTAGIANTIPLGWQILPGTYRFGTPAMTGTFWRETSGNTWPIPIGSAGTVSGQYLANIATVGSAFSTTSTTWYYAYNWSIREMCSSSPRIPVIATVTPPPALTFTKDVDSVCSGQLIDSVKLSAGAASYTSFTWSSIPAATVPSGNIATTGVRVTNTTPGDYKYIINAEQTTGSLCKNSDTFYLKVKRIPLPIVSSPSGTLNLCNGIIQELNASSKLIDSAIVGTGTVNIGSASGNPFRPGAGNTAHRLQYLISAAEINATSLQAGALTALGFTANNVSTGTMTNYQIRLGHTSATTLSTAFLTQPSTLVHSVGTYGPTTVGWNMFYFNQSNVFEWNGTDNILVEICYTTTTGTTATVVGGPVAGVAIPTVHATAATCGTTATGTTVANRPHIRLVQNVKNPITWSPTAGLFTNAVASSAYTSGAKDTVWSAHNDTIKYYMTATHSNGCAIKDSITLNIKDTVTITSQPPAFAAFCAGDTLKLCVSASSTSPITYQWKRNGLNIPCALNASACTPCLLIPNAAPADSGTYEVDITTGTPCGTKTSMASTVKVRLPINITTQPKDTTVCLGAPFALNAAASNDSSRTWTQIGGTNTATTNTFSVTAAAYSDSGRYFITYIPQTPCAVKHSDTVRARVLPAAQILTDPATLTSLCIGDSVILKPTHSAALGFQWLKNGSPIPGLAATRDTFVVKANSQADSGIYQLVVKSPTGCNPDTTSITAGIVKVNLPVNITVQPLSKTFVCQNSPFNASVTASNTSGYQWEKNAVTIFAATNSSFIINSTQPSDAGVFRVLVKGIAPCPDVYSTNDTLVVTTLAAITTPPTAFQVCEDQSINITGAASNAASYQWLRNGLAISPNGNVQTYTKGGSPATMADSGMYRLVALSNPAGATTCKADTSVAVLGAVVRKIQITTQPLVNTFVCQNSAFNTSIVAQNVTGYQWRKGASNVSTGTGGTTANYSISSTQPADAGVYSVLMTGNTPCPTVTSTNNILAVTTLAAITTPPTAFQVCEDQFINITGVASNAASYQWLRNGVAISPNGNVQTYTKGGLPATMADSGRYRLVALSANAGATTCKADTTPLPGVLGAVVRKIVVTTQPPVFSYGCLNANFSMNIVAQNVTGYSWRLNGNPIGQTTATMSRTPFVIADTGTYTVVMTGNSPCPSVTSANAKVDPTTAAVISTEPQSTAVCLANTLTLTVAASAQQSYQWRKNGVNIVGQTGSSFTIPSVAYSDAATYDVIAIAFNGCTNDTSIGAVVTISTPLAITTPLANTDVKCEGQNITYTTGASGTGPFTYSWTLNGLGIGTNNANYSKTSVLVADSGRYIVNIQGSPACPAVRDTIDLDVNKAPVIVTQPNGASPVCIGNNVVLNAAASNHTTVEWHKQGIGNLGQTGFTYSSIGSATTSAGDYFVIARAQPACADVTSNIVSIQINIPANIALQPQGIDLLENPAGSHTMSVLVSGTGPFVYKWFKNGIIIPGAVTSSFAISNYVASIDSGNYHVEVTSPAPCSNTVVSNIAKIATVKCPKLFGDTIRAVNICAGRPFSLDITATGAKSYQWFKNNVAISGADKPNYSIPKSNPSHAGIYRCRVFAFNEAICDATYTDSIVVTVKDKPTITKHPEGIKMCAVSTHTMKVVATFGETFQWYRNGIAISPDGDKDSFIYNNVNTIGDEFYVEVGNNLCPSANSNSVVIKSVIPGNQVFLANNSEFDLIERCSDANGWTYYATTTQTERLLMAIKKNGNMITAKPDLELMNGIREISSINAENKGAILGGRIFNLDITGSIVNPYELKFYYNKAEGDAVLARLNDIKLANPGQFSTDKIDLSFILSTQQAFTSSLWNNLTIPLNIPHTVSFKDKEFGVENGVNFVILKQLVSPKLGGTIYMDYKLKTSSSVTQVDKNGFGFSLYPVPTTDGKVTVDVSSKKLKPITFTVTDMTGRTVAVFNEKHTSLESSHAFDFSQLANGNYQLMISNDEESAVGRFTISK